MRNGGPKEIKSKMEDVNLKLKETFRKDRQYEKEDLDIWKHDFLANDWISSCMVTLAPYRRHFGQKSRAIQLKEKVVRSEGTARWHC